MSLSRTQLSELSHLALTVAEEASHILMSGYRSRPHADEKGRADLVTEFDRLSEAYILERLTLLTSEIPVVGEEQSGADEVQRPGLVWYVDPLDGTTNFVHGHPFFNVSIGLMQDDEPVVGAVVAPVLGLRYCGHHTKEDGGEAFRNGERCQVSPITSFAKSMLATGFPGDRKAGASSNFGSFVAVKRTAQAVRRCGSAAIDLCFVADGTYEGFWERHLHTWDVCAASALILAAGGRITAIDGGPVRYHAGHIAASNGKIHDDLLVAILRGEEQVI